MVTAVMGHNIQSVMEHVDNNTVHLNRSFLIKIEYDIIALAVKKKKWLTLIPGCVYLKYGWQFSKRKMTYIFKGNIYIYMYIYVCVCVCIYITQKQFMENKCPN